MEPEDDMLLWGLFFLFIVIVGVAIMIVAIV